MRLHPAFLFSILVNVKTSAQRTSDYRARLRADPIAWEAHLKRSREQDRKRKPRRTPRPEEFDWSLIWNQKQRSDATPFLIFGAVWADILFISPSLWKFRRYCATLNRRHALKMKARWINGHNPRHVEHTRQYNSRVDIAVRRRESHVRIRKATEHIRKTPEFRAKVAKYCREHANKSPQRRISLRLRTRVYEAIKLGGGRRSQRTEQLLGCTIPELMQHLEAQFLPGMSLENYGLHGWHIDHKTPCAAFDLTDETQQRICFHHTNLQPLWSSDNWSKSSKLPNGLKARRKPVSVSIST